MANEASFQLNAEKGGINWGYCAEKKGEADKEATITYSVHVETSSLEGSETISTIKMKFFGNTGESKLTTLSDVGFERGSSKKLEFKALDVGNLQKIQVKHLFKIS